VLAYGRTSTTMVILKKRPVGPVFFLIWPFGHWLFGHWPFGQWPNGKKNLIRFT